MHPLFISGLLASKLLGCKSFVSQDLFNQLHVLNETAVQGPVKLDPGLGNGTAGLAIQKNFVLLGECFPWGHILAHKLI